VVKLGGVNSVALAKFIVDLKVLQRTLPAILRKEDIAVAGTVARTARARGAGLGGVHRHAAEAIKAVNQRPIIRLHGEDHPEIFGAEFGGGARPTTRQFPPWRGSGETAGYMLYPTIRELSEEAFEERYAGIIEKSAGFT
jgi:hypothetical protein